MMKKAKVPIINGVILAYDQSGEACLPVQGYNKFLDVITDKETGEEYWAADFYFKDIQGKIIWLCIEYGEARFIPVDEYGEPSETSEQNKNIEPF